MLPPPELGGVGDDPAVVEPLGVTLVDCVGVADGAELLLAAGVVCSEGFWEVPAFCVSVTVVVACSFADC